MPFCGFNEKMLKGLTAFCEGLVEHGIVYRSNKNGETTDQAIKREISDLARIMLETNRIDDSAKRLLTEGVAKYAMGFYLLIRRKGIEDYEDTVKKLMEYFYFMDEKYYNELDGKSDDMENLIIMLDKKEI